MRNQFFSAIQKFQSEFSGLRCKIMEVCGTHTNVIRKAGIHQLLPPEVQLLSGPGCPVCVTGSGYIEQAVKLSLTPKVIITTFGDLLKVPGNSMSLSEARANGGNIKIVYSPLDAVATARDNPDKSIIFLGVGFETTAPAIALAILKGHELGLTNFFILPAIKVLRPAMETLLNDPELRIDGLIAPGHLSVITGANLFAFLPEQFKLPTVITGFGTEDLWLGLMALLQQIKEGVARLENKYPRVVTEQGNLAAQLLIKKVFDPEDTEWRGLGTIKHSGLGLSINYCMFDAREHFKLSPIPSQEPEGCQCGQILLGKLSPEGCPQFSKTCTPEHPIGPCMVSSEGSCAAHFYYRDSLS